MPWKNCIAVGRAKNLLRADLLEQLAWLQKQIGYRYCRFHAIFDDEMQVVVRQPDGAIGYQWQEIDKAYDALLRLGLRPFVELNPMPQALASGSTTMFFYKMNVTPPKSYEEWEGLVEAFTRHIIQRYGLEEVRQWYFEVWNEPDFSLFWTGTQEDYWKLYDASARALKRVDARLRVGGPASAQTHWVEDMLKHADQAKVPLDFISTHLYPQDEQILYPDRKGSPHALGNFFSDMVKQTRQKVSASSRPDLEIHWTEWNTIASKDASSIAWVNNPQVDNLFAASFIVRNCIELDQTVSSLTYWTASDIFDESGIINSPFSGSYGLLTLEGIPKASCNAFRLLNKMRGELFTAQPDSPLAPGRGLCVTKEADTWHIIAWNQNFVEQPTQTDWLGSLKVPAPLDKPHLAIAATIGIGGGSSWESWQAMGCPQTLSPGQFEFLQAQAQPTYEMVKLTPVNQSLSVPFHLKPNEVRYWELQAAPGNAQRHVSWNELEPGQKVTGNKSQ